MKPLKLWAAIWLGVALLLAPAVCLSQETADEPVAEGDTAPPAGSEVPEAEAGEPAAPKEEEIPQGEREIVLDRVVRVESVGVEFSTDVGWSSKKNTAGFSRLLGRGPTVHGLRTALGVWHMESRHDFIKFYSAFKNYLKEKNPGFKVKKEELDLQVDGHSASRIDLTGEIASGNAQVSIPVTYSYVIVDRRSRGTPVSKTIFNLVWPEQEDVYYNRYWEKLLQTCKFYGPGFSIDEKGKVSFAGYTFNLPTNWNLDIENDTTKNLQDKKPAFRITLTNNMTDKSIKIKTLLFDDVSSPKHFAEKLKDRYVKEKNIPNLELESLGEKGRYRVTFPYVHEGEPYTMVIYVSGGIGNILQSSSYIEEESLKQPIELIGSSILPPPIENK